jgi:hypothetical protein
MLNWSGNRTSDWSRDRVGDLSRDRISDWPRNRRVNDHTGDWSGNRQDWSGNRQDWSGNRQDWSGYRPSDSIDKNTQKIASYSITKPYEANQIINFIISNCISILKQDTYTLTITDGTAGSGGDALNFTAYFDTVHAYEKCPMMFELLKTKVADKKNISVYNADFTAVNTAGVGADVIYLDPPWGGKTYKYKEQVELKFGHDSKIMNVSEFVRKLLKQDRKLLVFIKVPFNADVSDFDVRGTLDIYNRSGYVSFNIILCTNVV